MEASTRRVIDVDPVDENDRYHRQTLITWWDQERLAAAKVLVVGAGALGNELVKSLALVGVGHIFVVDLDAIEDSNLARCVFFRAEDEGEPKATVLADRASELNPGIEIIGAVGDIRATVGLGAFAEFDVVVAGLDNREARLFVNQACWKTSTPWVDGAIEGLMGVVRVFIPPDTACYECTMSEADRQMVARRRACSLLTREDLREGKVPTTATTASVIAGMQVQEVIKLLHHDRLDGTVGIKGAGYQFVGLSHDSYVVRYHRREDCLAHDTYSFGSAEVIDPDTTFGSILRRAQRTLGPDAILDLEQDIAVGAKCQACGATTEFMRPMVALTTGSGICPDCGRQWRIDFTHTITPDSPLEQLRPRGVGLPPADVVTARAGNTRLHYLLHGRGSALEEVARGAA